MPFRQRGPRNDQSQRDAIITHGRAQKFPRADQSDLDARIDSRYAGLDVSYLRRGIEPRPVVTVAGTFFVSGVLESEVVTGGETITFASASPFDFAATLGGDNALTTAFLAAITGDDLAGNGFDDEVTLVHGNLVRTNAFLMTLTLPASAGYSIGEDEVISAVLPNGTFTAETGDLTVPIGTITENASVTLSGTAIGGVLESEIVSGTETVIFTIVGDQWAATLGADNAVTSAFLAAITGDHSGAGSFDDEVALVHGNLTRDSNTQLTLILPATAGYSITTTDEDIDLDVPEDSMVKHVGTLTVPQWTITEGL